jgi:uncharacterized glyoxalase superfamily protein PhnB
MLEVHEDREECGDERPELCGVRWYEEAAGDRPDLVLLRERVVMMAARLARQRVVPHLGYEDPFAALAWLCRVFGFREVRRFDRGEGNLTARLRAPDGGVVMISGHDADFKDWMRERAPRFEEASGKSWPLLTHRITVIVDDVDVHFERAEAEGAPVLSEPKDQPWGVRSYAALDPEGHQWEFATVRSDLSEE